MASEGIWSSWFGDLAGAECLHITDPSLNIVATNVWPIPQELTSE